METKGITCKIPLDLHNRISEEMREKELTVSQYIELVIREHMDGGIHMGKTRTLAFQVSEELFQRIKDYLDRYEQTYRRKLTQKEFVIGLIEQALEEAEEEFEAAGAARQEEQAEEGGEAAEAPEMEDTPAGEGENAWDEETGGFEAHSEEPEPDSESEDEPESDSDEESEDYTEPEESTENEDNPYYA